MTNNKTPDDATGDGVTLARVHTFFAALLTFLGLGHVPDATVLGMLDELTRWLEMAKAIRRDPQGATARIWWDAFKLAREFDPVTSRVAHAADEYTAEFGKRFLPVAEEDRDTLNTADFAAMRAELDQADRYRGEICDALDGIAGERMFVHPKIIDELRAERDALLKANAHHASEIESLRQECDKLKALRSADLLEMASAANALDAVRLVIGQKNLPDADVGAAVALAVAERDTWKSDALSCHMVLAEIRDSFVLTPSWNSAPWSELPIRVRARQLERVKAFEKEIDELKAQLASAIVPLPKPERVEAGQRWAITFYEVDGDGDPWLGYRYLNAGDVLRAGTYLGKDA